PATSTPPPTTVNADTGASGHYISPADATALCQLQPTGTAGIEVTLPDGTTTAASHTGLLPIPGLSTAARRAHVFPSFTGSLLYIGQFCDADHTIEARFNWHGVSISRGSEVFLSGARDPTTRNYMIDLPPPDSTYPVANTERTYSAAPVIRSQSDAERVRFYLTALGSPELETYFRTTGLEFQYAPPHNHRANGAERAIQTFKDHFIAKLATCDPEFPLLDWDLLIPQAELTINLLRPCEADPTVSAWTHIHGHPYAYESHPFGAAGCKVVIHDRADNRASWDAHGTVGFYVGPSYLHYRCHRVFMPSTHKIRVTDTLAWFPRDTHLHGSSNIEQMTAAIADLQRAIETLAADPYTQHPATQQPLCALVPTLMAQLDSLRDIFHDTAPVVSRTPPSAPAFHMAGPPPGAP
ncbi:hypothetical protein B484DRAFT_303302, partial [Ochromonadaceae sp. CCMP2298]